MNPLVLAQLSGLGVGEWCRGDFDRPSNAIGKPQLVYVTIHSPVDEVGTYILKGDRPAQRPGSIENSVIKKAHI